MKELKLLDKTFTLSKITAYSLSMEIDYRHLAYTIVDHIRRRFVALIVKDFDQQVTEENFLDIVDSYIKSDQYLQKHYKEVNFIYPSDKFILVPEEYFDKENLKLYFESGNELKQGEEIQFNYIPEVKTYLVFAISSNITNFFVYRFPEINFYHQAIPLIKKYVQFSKETDNFLVAINIRRRFLMDILILSQGRLLYYNIFKCQGEQNAFYNIMRVLKDFDYGAQVDLMGEITKDDWLYQNLSKYLPNLGFATLQKSYTLDFGQDFDVHRFANLFYIPD